MSLTSAEIITAARVNLREETASIWPAADMAGWIAQVAREISRKNGVNKRANFALVDYTREIDLGALPYLEIIGVEYPVTIEAGVPIFRPYKQFGTTLALDINEIPTIVSGTLTGTVTWTPGDRSVTGSGTLFTSELTEGNLIRVGKLADGATKWYQIAHITSDTALSLVEPFKEDTTDDTVSLTKYRDYDSCVRVYYTGEYTIGATSDLPARYDELAILGVVAHAATEFAAYHIASKLTDVTTKIGLANTQVGLITARLAQVVTDLASGRTNFNTTQITTDMASIETTLDQVLTDLDAGRTVTNAVNVGGDVTGKYIDTAKTDIEEAHYRIEKVKAYIDEPKANVSIAEQEINAAAGYVNQAGAYLQMADRDLQTDRVVSSYKGWAEKKLRDYQEQLNNIGPVKVRFFGTRDL